VEKKNDEDPLLFFLSLISSFFSHMSLIQLTSLDEFIEVPVAPKQDRLDQLEDLVGGSFTKIYQFRDYEDAICMAYCSDDPNPDVLLPNQIAYDMLIRAGFIGSEQTPGTFLGTVVLTGRWGRGLSRKRVHEAREIYDDVVEKKRRKESSFGLRRQVMSFWRMKILNK
jgi:hypothetical protein